jgi:aspartate-semialdehyde dehydrogenase
MKMILETKKILGDDSLKITATAVRVPIFNSHSESVNVELSSAFEINEVKSLLSNSPGIVLQDDPQNGIYPLAADATGTDPVYVGRIRRDESLENGLNLWIVADNIRKGAATNTIQIAETLIERGMV